MIQVAEMETHSFLWLASNVFGNNTFLSYFEQAALQISTPTFHIISWCSFHFCRTSVKSLRSIGKHSHWSPRVATPSCSWASCWAINNQHGMIFFQRYLRLSVIINAELQSGLQTTSSKGHWEPSQTSHIEKLAGEKSVDSADWLLPPSNWSSNHPLHHQISVLLALSNFDFNLKIIAVDLKF